MLKQINGKWCLVSKTTRRPLAYYSGKDKPSDEWVAKQEARIEHFREDLGFNTISTQVLFTESYIKAAKRLKNILKLSENKTLDIHRCAVEVAKQYHDVDSKKLIMMVETFDILENLGYNLLVEIVDTPGYKPIGIAEFFRFMSHPKIPQEDKNAVKKLSALHASEPKSGHDQKIREIFNKHGISLGEVIPKKKPISDSLNIKSDILPVSGAGQEGTDHLCSIYKNSTPGQLQKIKNALKKI